MPNAKKKLAKNICDMDHWFSLHEFKKLFHELVKILGGSEGIKGGVEVSKIELEGRGGWNIFYD